MSVEVELIDTDAFVSETPDTDIEEIELTVYAEHIDDRND